MIAFSKLLRAAKSLTPRQMILLAVLLLVLLGFVLTLTLSKDKGSVSVMPVAEKVVAEAVQSTTTTAGEQPPAATPPATTGGTVSSQTPAQKPTQPAAPQTPQQLVLPPTPQAPPAETPQEPPVEEAPEEDYIVVAASGASESVTLSTDDGSAVRWYSCNAGAVTSDDQLPDKSAFKVYLVMETAVIDENGLVPASSVTFHVRATADAPLGILENTTDDPMTSLSLSFCIADENYNIIQVYPVPVMVVAPAES